LRRSLRPVFLVFLVGAASLSAVPLVTAGFYSKDLILGMVLSSGRGGPWLWAVGVLGAFLTSMYAFRLVFLVFFGTEKQASPRLRFGRASWIPLGTLAVLAVVAGFIQLPQSWKGPAFFTDFLSPALPLPQLSSGGFAGSAAPQVIVALASLAGIYVSYLLFARASYAVQRFASRPTVRLLDALALEGWGFDRLYHLVFVRPFVWVTRSNKDDVIDSGFSTIAWSAARLNGLLSRTQTGRLRYYVGVAAAGVVIFVALGVFR
jgi:NADH-quinone oxidoreductase subunit L